MNRVKEFRERRGFAAEALAERVGVSERFLRALEENSSVASVEIGFKLAVALEAPFAELFGLDEAPGADVVFGRVETPSEPPSTEIRAGRAAETDEADGDDAEEDGEFAGRGVEAVDDDASKDVEFAGRGVEAVDDDAEEDGEFVGRGVEAVDDDAEEDVEFAGCGVESVDDASKDGGTDDSGDEPDDAEDALQRTALAAKKWAEKSLEIAAACDFDLDENKNEEVGKKGRRRKKGKESENGENDENEATGEVRRTRAPRRSEVKSSPTSKTAAEEGLAASPAGLADPTAGRPIRFFDLFCGIGGFRFAAERTLAKMRRDGVCALSCDFDPPAQTSYEANFGERPFGDVAELPSEAIPDFDLLFAGFPCQAFSIIGLRKGFADETKGSLFFQIARILHDKRPRAFVLENVRQLTTHDGGRTFETILRILQEELGYCVDWRILNALDCGLPQKRERVAIVGALEPFEIAWPKPKTDGKTLADVLEPDAKVDKKHFASPEIVKRRKEMHSSQYFPAIWHENKSGNISSYPYSCALRAGASYNYLLVNGERRLTPREMLRLQGFPDSFKIAVSDAQIRKQAGNAAPVDLIERVLDRFLPLVFAQGDAAPPTNATSKSAAPPTNATSESAEPPTNATSESAASPRRPASENEESTPNAIPGGLF
ncbi:MAG: DNA (cytosine-5-)-methyltransferase [Thermoguttaceae bacterium]|nr:DNA (cytosine-5-)-methyltransferase [Thermoguttaceae bacterium]MBR4102510.1 DNA (cytosine-5-)-methyltransferase [Thermoguttaceae bacterium]